MYPSMSYIETLTEGGGVSSIKTSLSKFYVDSYEVRKNNDSW